MKRGRLALALVVVSVVAPIAGAHVVSDRELKLIAQLPPGFGLRALASSLPDSFGCVAPNRSGHWLGIGCQRPCLLLLLDAAARGDSALAERAWLALDAGFARQRPEGSFQRDGHDPDRGAELMDETAWLAGTCRAWIAIMNSPLQDRFRLRYALFKPKAQRAADFLESRADSLLGMNARSGGALLIVAAAFLLADGTYHDERYGRVGQAALAAALATQSPAGLFPIDGSADVERHALGLEALQSIVIYFPSPSLERAETRATMWLRGHAGRGMSRSMTRRVGGPRVAPGEVDFILRYATITPPPPLGLPSRE